MAISYELQVAQVNEKLVLESFSDLTLMQHFRGEDPKPREVHIHLEVDPLRA